MKKRIIVTGGAGYIGSHTAKELSKNGYEVITVDNLIYGHKEFVNWGSLEETDLLDIEDVRNVFIKYQPIHAIMHFAAFAYVGESIEKPDKYYRNNIVGSLNLFQTAIEFQVPFAVFSSTCATYGIPQKIPIPDNHSQNPINPYGFTKFAIERLLQDFDKAFGFRSVSLRYFNAAGADPDPDKGKEIGEDHNPETHLIPLIFDAAIGKRNHIGIFGTDYPTQDGTAIRDYIHVQDLANAHFLALKYLEGGGLTNSFNLGNGEGFSVKDVIEKAKKVIGSRYDFEVKEEPRRPGDPPCLISDRKKIEEMLRWKPGFPSLENILEHAWNWHLFRFLQGIRV